MSYQFIKNYSHNLVLYQFPTKKFIITITSNLFHCKPVLIGFLLSQNWSSKLLRVLPSGINPRILFGYCFFNKFFKPESAFYRANTNHRKKDFILQSTQDTDLRYNPQSPMRVFNLHWYKDQMSGWMTSSYILLACGTLFLLATGLYHNFNALGITSTIAGIIGFTCTLSITNGKPINGVLGFVSALMLIYVASTTGNYSDVVMQTAYIFLLDIPVVLNKNWNSSEGLSPRLLTGKYIGQTVVTFIIFWAITYGLDTVILTSPRPVIDSLSATIGLTGAILTVRRFRSSYYFWFAQSIMSITLWSVTAIAGHPVWVLFFTYCLYLLNDIIALASSKWFHDRA